MKSKFQSRKWRNIEYVFVPELTRKPHGTPSRRFAGPVTRIEYVQNGMLGFEGPREVFLGG